EGGDVPRGKRGRRGRRGAVLPAAHPPGHAGEQLHQAQAQHGVLRAACLLRHASPSPRLPRLTGLARSIYGCGIKIFLISKPKYMEGGMASSGQLTSSALQALLRGGELAGSWTLDPARSEVLLKTRHTWGLFPLAGVFRQASGNGTVTAAGDVSGVFTVAGGSIDTKNKRRDEHLRSADFFDVASHPDFTFTAEGGQPADGGVRGTGPLTIRGPGHPLSF